MLAEVKHCDQDIPPGVRHAGKARGWRGLIPDIPVRCRRQARDEPPIFSRPRFGRSIQEASGAFGDLGTFIPHIMGAIALVGMAPAGIFITFGLFYIFSGVFYGLPVAVQPMKAASAVVLTTDMTPGEIAGAGIALGLFFLIIGATGLVDRFARLIPPVVTSGLQLGLGLALAIFGIELIREQLWLGFGIAVLILLMLKVPRLPAALLALAAGIVAGQLTGLAPPPELSLGLHLPPVTLPEWRELLRGVELAALPQIPLTLTNAIIVAAAVSRQLFPKEVHAVNERNLSMTTGIGNLLAAPFGGYPMCHGAGGMTAHYRFGARTATAPLLIGVVFLGLGVLFGDAALALLRTVPEAVLGALLLFTGVELAQSSKPQDYRRWELFVLLVMTGVGIAWNPAVAFAVGLPLEYLLRRRWLSV